MIKETSETKEYGPEQIRAMVSPAFMLTGLALVEKEVPIVIWSRILLHRWRTEVQGPSQVNKLIHSQLFLLLHHTAFYLDPDLAHT